MSNAPIRIALALALAMGSLAVLGLLRERATPPIPPGVDVTSVAALEAHPGEYVRFSATYRNNPYGVYLEPSFKKSGFGPPQLEVSDWGPPRCDGERVVVVGRFMGTSRWYVTCDDPPTGGVDYHRFEDCRVAAAD